MKSILRGILDFLERKFPDRLEVTLSDYQNIAATVGMHGDQISDMAVRLQKLEAHISNLNLAMGFGAKMNGSGVLER